MPTQQDIDYMRREIGGVGSQNLSDADISAELDRAADRVAEKTGIPISDQTTYISNRRDAMFKFAYFNLTLRFGDKFADAANRALRDAKEICDDLGKPESTDPDAEVIIDAADYESYPLNPSAGIYFGSKRRFYSQVPAEDYVTWLW
jgi:hypothetical protein